MKKGIVAIIVVVVAAAAFAVGWYWGQSSAQAAAASQLAASQTRRFGQNVSGQTPTGQAGRAMTEGEILSKTDTGLVLKLSNGGSQIVLVSGQTSIGKFTNIGLGDLQAGDTVSISGVSNADGSVTAQSVQIRPKLPTGSGGAASSTPNGAAGGGRFRGSANSAPAN